MSAHTNCCIGQVKQFHRPGYSNECDPSFFLNVSTYYGRSGGTGQAFFQNALEPLDFKWMILLAVFSIFLGWRGIWLNMLFALTLAAILGYYRSRMGCITVDMLGAMTEVMGQ